MQAYMFVRMWDTQNKPRVLLRSDRSANDETILTALTGDQLAQQTASCRAAPRCMLVQRFSHSSSATCEPLHRGADEPGARSALKLEFKTNGCARS